MEAMDNLAEIRKQDNESWLHPWESMADVGRADRTVVSRAEGIYVYDEAGRRLIDGPGGMWCMQIGYGRQEMADAIAQQIMQVPYMNPFSLTSEPPARLAAKLAELAPGDLNRVFLTTGGSTAVDTALRFVHFYNNVKGRPNKKHVISRASAYHGSTYLCSLVTGKDRDRNWFDIGSPQVHFLPSVNPARRPAGMSLDAFAREKARDLEAKILELGADQVGAFIAEPIQSSGGVIVPPDGYLRQCWEICRKYDVLYISDEVVTGFGRLGHWFASKDVFGIEPDLITCAKGLTSGYLPLGACLISDRVFAEVSGSRAKGATFGHGFTYSGHPVCSVAALKNIEIIEREGILGHVRELSPYFQARLQELREIPIVFDVRGMGLVGCVECTVQGIAGDSLAFDSDLGARIDRHCQALGLMLRPIVNQCVFSPPLVITKAAVDQMIDAMREGIVRAQHEIEQELGISIA
ncbi:aminotransferase [Burkholderia pseudomultivorans]|uniref:Putrescine--pyruvate aminotransferase n=2 Tax=Burkholderia pseudomultivorans TaxID=1207504 RepID=A0ABU2E451_9BURK|nr:aminotransferase [Burkholderia pseudomultivorans]MDR8737032.1 Putrescine--pyruvate aminotransferase [Burkholderia pseudomultivorans]MDR8743073.1 Putrescine--pyruvate aminotransferase [Burkholderia pseudomultivorans]MDR8754448.1 Putrescine--pyruvate aminotransferase [Burkholderia pseudomultivorans]MDR8779801.1 Putrescine--pyruvate aminotransferase [Burkholderia pseudomultivorans]MDR8818360.1 Putrescine--pyruvate aminotransferase [Burkholderia pseudomultivorans]